MSVNNKISLNTRITLNIKMEGARHGGVSAWFVKYSSKSQLKKKNEVFFQMKKAAVMNIKTSSRFSEKLLER